MVQPPGEPTGETGFRNYFLRKIKSFKNPLQRRTEEIGLGSPASPLEEPKPILKATAEPIPTKKPSSHMMRTALERIGVESKEKKALNETQKARQEAFNDLSELKRQLNTLKSAKVKAENAFRDSELPPKHFRTQFKDETAEALDTILRQIAEIESKIQTAQTNFENRDAMYEKALEKYNK